MVNYEKLGLSRFIGHRVIIGLVGGTFREGVLDIDLINEDWEEDGERETLGLLVGERLEGIYLDTIKFIVKVSEVSYVEKAISA